MHIKALLFLILSVFLFLPLNSQEVPRDGDRFSPPEKFYEEASSPPLTRPVVVPLSRIPQRVESNAPEEEEFWNAGEKELENKIISIPTSKNAASQTFLQRDRIQAAQTVLPPSIRRSFPGLPCTVQAVGHRGQPDSILAVGSNRVLVAVNHTIAIYTKTGQLRFQTSFEAWFSSLKELGDAILFDPRLLYDSYNGQQHFIFNCILRRFGRSFIMMSVSKTADPEGEWSFWALDMERNGTKSVYLWADFDRLGADQNGIYLAADMTTFNTIKFRYNKIRVLKKSEVYSFGPLSWHDFWNMTDATGQLARHIEPAQSFGNTGAEYLINTRPDAGNVITLWKITNAGSNPQLTMTGVTVADYVTATVAAQKGSNVGLVAATEGTSVLKAISRNGSIYASHAISHDWGSGPVSAIRFYQLDTQGNVIQQVTYGSDGTSYYMPTLAVNSSGDVVLGFNRSSQSQYAGVFFAGRRATDPLNKFSNSVALHKGLGPYTIVFARSNIGPWGDYMGTALAPDNTFWIFGQYAINPGCWGTQIGQVAY